MHVNIGQIHAKPIAPSQLTQNFVLHSSAKTPTLLVRTQGTAPNIVIGAGDYNNQQLQSITSAIQQLGTFVTRGLFPEHQTLVDGLCLIFDSMGHIDEILSDESTELPSFRLDEVIAFGQVPFDSVRLSKLTASSGVIRSIWPQIPAFLGFVLQVRSAYFAGPVDPAMLATEAPQPATPMVHAVSLLWEIFATTPSNPDK